VTFATVPEDAAAPLGQSARAATQISTTPVSITIPWPWRAANPGSARDHARAEAPRLRGAAAADARAWRSRAVVSAKVPSSDIVVSSRVVSTMPPALPATSSRASAVVCGSHASGRSKTQRNAMLATSAPA